MNGYIALKNITLSGTEYLAGTPVPADAVLASRANALIRNGMIAEVDGEEVLSEEAEFEVVVPVRTDDGVMELSVSAGDIVQAITVLQMKQEEAEAAVAAMESGNALILVDACSKNQTVRKAARARAAILGEGEA